MIRLMLLLAVTASAAAAPSPAPMLVVREPGHDLGKLRQAETVRFNVRLENLAYEPIKVVGGNSSCNCLEMELPITLAAKEIRDVTATFRTEMREGEVVARLTLAVEASRPAPGVDVWANCEVVPEFRADTKVAFGRVAAGAAVRRTLRIEPVAASDATVTAVEVDPPVFVATSPSSGPGKDWLISVEPNAELPQGEYRALVVVRTTSTRRPEVRVPVSCTIDRGYVLSVDQAMLGIRDYERAEEGRARITISRADGQPVEFGRAEPSAPYITARCEAPGAPPRECAVEIAFSLALGRPPSNAVIDETVVLHDGAGRPVLRIPVRALLRSAEPCCAPSTAEGRAKERAALERGMPPYFRTEDAEGRLADSGAFAGTPTMLLFFCGCPACHAIAVDLARLDPKPFAVYGLLHWDPEKARGFAERTGFPGRLLLDTGARIGERYGVPACPYLVVLDEQGRIVHRRLVHLERGASVLQQARDALAGNR
ncbi:MAG: TlpA family protein disulfide reductase [Armatimonadetes bacterium]|nr:TlpA family protein disulfide reductase [Armatimonadota bacterium]